MTYAEDIIAGKYKIPINWLHTQAYCEYQIFLEHVKGVKVGKSPAMVKGSLEHHLLDFEHAAEVTAVMSLETACLKSAEEKVTYVARDVEVENKYLKGRIDEIRIAPSQITIIDDKPAKEKVWLSDKRQVWGYCWAYTDKYKADRPVYGSVRNRSSKEVVWEECFTQEAKKEVEEATKRILGILKGKSAVPTRKPQKCRPCRFKRACDRALA